jgi:hypothetical protein
VGTLQIQQQQQEQEQEQEEAVSYPQILSSWWFLPFLFPLILGTVANHGKPNATSLQFRSIVANFRGLNQTKALLFVLSKNRGGSSSGHDFWINREGVGMAQNRNMLRSETAYQAAVEQRLIGQITIVTNRHPTCQLAQNEILIWQ